MKIAAITNYCNENQRLDDWVKYYQEYKSEIAVHIIINNGKIEDSSTLKGLFPESIVLFSNNKALTSSINIALKESLKTKEVDAILLIGNDIKINKGSVTKLYEFLYSTKEFGMVAPILLHKDSEIVELYGASINPKTLQFFHLHAYTPLNQIKDNILICDGVPGGMNIAKREFYEKVGFQDEYLFMYSDEVDMGIRGKKAGFTFASTKNILAWHQHVNLNNSPIRNPRAYFFWGRNEIYLAKKHFGIGVIWSSITFRLKVAIRWNIYSILKKEDKKLRLCHLSYLKGVMAGIFSISLIPKQ